MGERLENVKVIRTTQNNKQLVRYIDKETNKVLAENIFQDRNGDGKFTEDELFSVAEYAYADDYMFKKEYFDYNHNRFPDKFGQSIYKLDENGKYLPRKTRIKNGDPFFDRPGMSTVYEKRTVFSMTDHAQRAVSVRDLQDEIDYMKKYDMKEGFMSSWDEWMK